MPCNESWIYCYDSETKRQSSQWEYAGSPRTKKARQSKSTHKLLMIPPPFFFDSTGMIYMHWVSTRTMHQSTTPSLSQTIWARWASRQFLSLPVVQSLLPVTFGYSLSSEAVMRQLRRWKRLWQRSLTRSHKRTSMGPSRSCWSSTANALQLEEITSKGTRVSCVYYQ